MGKILKWPPNDVIHFGCFYKILSVIHVIRGYRVLESVSSASMSILFHLSPYSEQEAQNYPTLTPILFLIEQNDFGM